MRIRRLFPGLLCISAGLILQIALDAASRDPLVNALEATYQITKTTFGGGDVTSAGAVLTIEQDGINAEPAGTFFRLDNKVVDGKVQPPGRWTQAVLLNTPNLHALKPGDKVYVVKIETKNDLLKFSLLTCDSYDVDVNGATEQKRYSAALSFKFPKDYLDKASPDEVEKIVEAVVIPQSVQAASSGTENQASSDQVPAPAPATISLGQTIDDVVAALGQPLQIVDLGTKKLQIQGLESNFY